MENNDLVLVGSAWPEPEKGDDPTHSFAFVGMTNDALLKFAATGNCDAGCMDLPNGGHVRIVLFTADDEPDLRAKLQGLAETDPSKMTEACDG